jgi:hypothetical protein
VQAAAALRSDAPDGNIQHRADFGIRRSGVGHEDSKQELAPAGQGVEGAPESLVALVRQQSGVDLAGGSFLRRLPCRIDGNLPLGEPQDPERFIAGCCREPAPDALRIPDVLEVLCESQPGCLAHVGRVSGVQAKAPRGGPDQAGKLPNESLPCSWLSREDGQDEPPNLDVDHTETLAAGPPHDSKKGVSADALLTRWASIDEGGETFEMRLLRNFGLVRVLTTTAILGAMVVAVAAPMYATG